MEDTGELLLAIDISLDSSDDDRSQDSRPRKEQSSKVVDHHARKHQTEGEFQRQKEAFRPRIDDGEVCRLFLLLFPAWALRCVLNTDYLQHIGKRSLER